MPAGRKAFASTGRRVGLPADCDLDIDGIADGTAIAIESTMRVNYDGVDSYEIGGKFTLPNRR